LSWVEIQRPRGLDGHPRRLGMQVEFIASPVSARGHRSVRYPGKDCMPLAPMQPRQAYTANRFCALKRLGQHIVRSPIQGFRPESFAGKPARDDRRRRILKQPQILPACRSTYPAINRAHR